MKVPREVVVSNSYMLDQPEVLASESSRLRIQAEVLFRIESALLDAHCAHTPRRILDIGCGTGIYLGLLQKKYPSALLFGVDRNQDLLRLAATEVPDASLEKVDVLSREDLLRALSTFSPDLIVLRFVLQHLTESGRLHLLEVLGRSCTKGCRVVVLEPDDSGIQAQPESEDISALVERVIQRQADNGGDRRVGCRLASLFQRTGFEDVKVTNADFGSASIGLANCESIYLPIWKSGIDLRQLDSRDTKRYQAAERWFRTQDAGTTKSLSYPMYFASGVVKGAS